jgi:hypothetical protein
MSLRMHRRWIALGLVAIVATFVASHKAHAALISTTTGIFIPIGMTQPIGDPTYEYIFDVQLLAGSTLSTGGFFTIYDIPSIGAGALTSQPSISWGSSVQLTGVTPSGANVMDSAFIENVTWQWNGASPIVAPASSNFDLGTFSVGVTSELASPPSPTLIYVGSLDGVTASNQGSVTVNAVPEPSSVILLLTGAGALPLLWLRQRRHRHSSSQHLG